MSGTIENGARLLVEFGDYSGVAGIVQRDGITQVAFRGRSRDFAVGSEGVVDDHPFRVLAVAGSNHLSSMVVLDVEPIMGTAST